VAWIQPAQDRVQLRAVVDAVMKFRVPYEGRGRFIDKLDDYQLLKKGSVIWS
jgi:hypothetical protein